MAGPGWGPYCTSKAGLIMLTKSLANDYGRFGVRANAVCPGFIVTDMADGAMEAIAKAWNTDVPGAYKLANRDIPLQRAGVVDEIAGAIAFLAGPDASYITGAAIPIDGGATIVDITATEAIFAGPR
jgi:meso-butanediol dehydrogenase/(S,S)-butanediol dehydrogenase/diacetyl reductase